MKFYYNLPHQTWFLRARNQSFIVETLYNTVARFDGVHGIDDLLSSCNLSLSAHMAEQLFMGQHGRPKYIFPQEQVECLVEWRFSLPQISNLLGESSNDENMPVRTAAMQYVQFQ